MKYLFPDLHTTIPYFKSVDFAVSIQQLLYSIILTRFITMKYLFRYRLSLKRRVNNKSWASKQDDL
ncbi:MAG: hypothetical protein C4527_25880 [Candidatus Omnitrophota bacterium]|nr:MAG: hypothetical protein C4527_25880 [Candidatus Omnitrophota bacterium]